MVLIPANSLTLNSLTWETGKEKASYQTFFLTEITHCPALWWDASGTPLAHLHPAFPAMIPQLFPGKQTLSFSHHIRNIYKKPIFHTKGIPFECYLR